MIKLQSFTKLFGTLPKKLNVLAGGAECTNKGVKWQGLRGSRPVLASGVLSLASSSFCQTLAACVIFALLCCTIPMNVFAEKQTTSIHQNSVLIENGATCWFADPRGVVFKHDNIYNKGKLIIPASSKTLIGAIDNKGTVKAVQYNNITSEKIDVIIDTNFQVDDHNNPTFLYLPDYRIMVLWSKHSTEPCWYYRVSQKPDDITTLGEKKCVSVKGYGNFTYPSAFYMTDVPNSFFLCWRGINWHPTIARYSLPDTNDNIVCEISPTQIISSVGARPYVKYNSNGKNRIYFAFTTAHPDVTNPNWCYYSEFDTNSFNLYDVQNHLLCTGNELPYGKINTSTNYGSLIVDSPCDKRNWLWDVGKDRQENPVILFTRISSDKKQHDYYYAKWNQAEQRWDKAYLADGGKWFHQNIKDLEKCYSAGMCLDHSDTSIVYVSKPSYGLYGKIYEIYKIEMDGTIIKRETQITKNSKHNNVRPFVPWNANATTDPIGLIWMNGLYYFWAPRAPSFNSFSTSIMMMHRKKRQVQLRK